MLKIKNTLIYLTKGDDATLNVKIKNREIYDDDVLELTVRKSYSSDVVLSKTADNGIFTFVPEDTKQLTAGLYTYDIQLTTFDGKIHTIVAPSTFEIGEEITR